LKLRQTKDHEQSGDHHENGDKLGGGKRSHISANQISSEIFQNEPAHTVKDQITASQLSVGFYPLRQQNQNAEVKEIQNAGDDLRRQQRHIVRRIDGLVKYDSDRIILTHLHAVTAAGQQTTDPADALCQCQIGHNQIEYL